MITIRCSKLGEAMTPAKSGSGIGVTAQKVFIQSYVQQTYGKFREVKSKQTEKGNACEPEAIRWISNYEYGRLYLKRYDGPELRNDWITGTPDVINDRYDCIDDVKSSFDAESHFLKKREPISKDHEWQLKGYCVLAGLSKGVVHHVLCNLPIEQMERQLINDHRYGNPELWEDLQYVSNNCYDREYFEYCVNALHLQPTDRNSLAIYKGFEPIPNERRHFKFETELTSSCERKIITCIEEGNRFLEEEFLSEF